MFEAAATFFSFSLVLREINTPDTGYPKGSPALFGQLCRDVFDPIALGSVARYRVKTRLACVLLSIVRLCRQKQSEDSRLLEPQAWRDYLNATETVSSDAFYKQVGEMVKEVSVLLA